MPQDKSAFQPAKEQTPQGYNFIDMEHKWLEHWYINGITDKYRHKNDASNEKFSFMDGPITANNPMGVHHAWGRSYKDLWQKFHNLLGQKQRFQNGFDCQGLWVEVEVEKELGLKSKKDIENLIPGYKQASIAKFVLVEIERKKTVDRVFNEKIKRYEAMFEQIQKNKSHNIHQFLILFVYTDIWYDPFLRPQQYSELLTKERIEKVNILVKNLVYNYCKYSNDCQSY
jgi:hypothetical protein